jgi:hypothetical protein
VTEFNQQSKDKQTRTWQKLLPHLGSNGGSKRERKKKKWLPMKCVPALWSGAQFLERMVTRREREGSDREIDAPCLMLATSAEKNKTKASSPCWASGALFQHLQGAHETWQVGWKTPLAFFHVRSVHSWRLPPWSVTDQTSRGRDVIYYNFKMYAVKPFWTVEIQQSISKIIKNQRLDSHSKVSNNY